MEAKMDVIAMGEVLIDFAMRGADENGYPLMQANPGGAPGNYLAALAKFGFQTGFIGKVGNDSFGHMLKRSLSEIGIDTSGLLMTDQVFTTLAFVTFDEHGDRSFSFARKPGADTNLKFDECDLDLIRQTKVFHFGTLSLTDEPAKTTTQKLVVYAKEQGKLISFDPNLRLPLWESDETAKESILWGLGQADVVKISDEEVSFLWGISPEEGAQKILNEYGVGLVFVTLGPDGCHFANQNGCGMVAAPSVNPVDTTGAGDIFGGSAMSGILKTGKKPEDLSIDEMEEIVRFASIAASLSTEKPGGMGSVPTQDEIQKLMS